MHEGEASDNISRDVKTAISVFRNLSVNGESESDSRGGFLQIAQGKGKESVTLYRAT